MILTAPRKPFYWTLARAVWDANQIARNTGLRQRVEVHGTRHGTPRFRIVPAKPVVR